MNVKKKTTVELLKESEKASLYRLTTVPVDPVLVAAELLGDSCAGKQNLPHFEDRSEVERASKTSFYCSGRR